MRASHRVRVSLQTKLTIVGVVLIECVMLALVFRTSLFDSAEAQSGIVVPLVAATSQFATDNVGIPVLIKIPSIELSATIEKVGLTKSNSLGVPKKPLNTGWYDLGPRPGELGSSVIDGHVNWWRGAKGAFEHLKLLKAGDLIEVQDENGVSVYFNVREIRTYNANADAMDVFSSVDGKSHLNLITCEGTWDKAAQQYTERLVVFADRIW